MKPFKMSRGSKGTLTTHLADTDTLEPVCNSTDIIQKLAIRNVLVMARLVGFPNYGCLVGILECMPVNAIVRGIQKSVLEKRHISGLERAVHGRCGRSRP